MVTTEKWGAPLSSGGACLPDRCPLPRSGTSRRAAFLAWCLLALAVLVITGCEPPGPAALRKGHNLIAAGRPADAVEPLKRAIRLLGTNDIAVAQAWNHLGLAYHQTQQYQEALAAYQAALTKNFNLFAARYNRGVLLLELNNLPAAINELTTYTTHEPRNPVAWLKLGIAQLRARQYDPADRSLQQVLALNAPPAVHAEALNNLGVSNAQRRRTREAFQFFNAALKAQTNYAPAILNQAILAQQQLGDRRLALGRYRAYLDAAPDARDRAEVQALVTSLDAALNPPAEVVAAPAPATQPPAAAAFSNLTELLSRTSTVTAAVLPPTNRASAPTSQPPAVVAIRPPEVRTSPPAPEVVVVTQAPPNVLQTPTVPAPAAQTSPPAVAVLTNIEPTPSSLPPRTPVAESPPEVVRVEPEPEVKVGGEVARTNLAGASTARPASGADKADASLVRPIGSDRAAEEKNKKSLLGRLNPLGWFGGSDEDAERKAREKAEKEAAKEARKRDKQRGATTPIPQATAEVKALPPAGPRTNEPPSVPPAPAIPRYRYANPVIAPTGDLAAARTPFEEGVRAQQANRLTDALAAYRRAVSAAPGYFDAWFNLGVTAALSGDSKTALEAYERALALKPADINSRFNLALALNAAGYPLDAVNELNAVLTAKPDFADAHLTLGGLYADQLKDIPKARTHYQKVLALSPRHPSAAEIRRWLAAHR